ncbi:MAG TPA: ornithine cyclodeaminase family protein [Kiloniellales bacterium]|nr:ornithine cyclodeaminase family protein [Kiloniellales bacterium]
MRFVDGAEIRRLLSFPKLIEALEAGHRRPPMEVADTFMGSEQALYFIRNAVDVGRFSGSKLVTSFPANIGSALPAVQAVVVLFDGTNGRPLAVMDGTEITYWRTAADSGLAARHLAPERPETLLVVGAGEMSRWLVRAHRTVRPSLKRVLIWNRTPARAEVVAATLRQEGLAAEAVDDLDEAIGVAEVITCCTRTHEPLVQGRLLRPGTHLDLVGGYTAKHREADDQAVKRSRIFVDRRESAHDVADIQSPLKRGVIQESDILGDLHAIVAGHAGRRAPEEITFFKNAGGAHLDLMTAELIWRQLK